MGHQISRIWCQIAGPSLHCNSKSHICEPRKEEEKICSSNKNHFAKKRRCWEIWSEPLFFKSDDLKSAAGAVPTSAPFETKIISAFSNTWNCILSVFWWKTDAFSLSRSLWPFQTSDEEDFCSIWRKILFPFPPLKSRQNCLDFSSPLFSHKFVVIFGSKFACARVFSSSDSLSCNDTNVRLLPTLFYWFGSEE